PSCAEKIPVETREQKSTLASSLPANKGNDKHAGDLNALTSMLGNCKFCWLRAKYRCHRCRRDCCEIHAAWPVGGTEPPLCLCRDCRNRDEAKQTMTQDSHVSAATRDIEASLGRLIGEFPDYRAAALQIVGVIMAVLSVLVVMATLPSVGLLFADC